VAPSTTDPTDPGEDGVTKFDRFTTLLTQVIQTPPNQGRKTEDQEDPQTVEKDRLSGADH
jgi:hypothetical protein